METQYAFWSGTPDEVSSVASTMPLALGKLMLRMGRLRTVVIVASVVVEGQRPIYHSLSEFIEELCFTSICNCRDMLQAMLGHRYFSFDLKTQIRSEMEMIDWFLFTRECTVLTAKRSLDAVRNVLDTRWSYRELPRPRDGYLSRVVLVPSATYIPHLIYARSVPVSGATFME